MRALVHREFVVFYKVLKCMVGKILQTMVLQEWQITTTCGVIWELPFCYLAVATYHLPFPRDGRFRPSCWVGRYWPTPAVCRHLLIFVEAMTCSHGAGEIGKLSQVVSWSEGWRIIFNVGHAAFTVHHKHHLGVLAKLYGGVYWARRYLSFKWCEFLNLCF